MFLLLFIIITTTYGTLVAERAPDPPRELTIDVISGKIVEFNWKPPLEGGVRGYRITIIPLSAHDATGIRNLEVGSKYPFPLAIRDLTPGVSYEVQIHSLLYTKSSNEFISGNFTTKPNPPGRLVLYYRNETTLMVQWEPPYQTDVFDQYWVRLFPEDANQSVISVPKGTESPRKPEAEFNELIPGRVYEISVCTVSKSQTSDASKVQYRTVPLPPTDVKFDTNTISSYSFGVEWNPPKEFSEFDRYQVSLRGRNSLSKIVAKNETRIAHFSKNLFPGMTYKVLVQSVSGNEASWPVIASVTTRPLPVIDLMADPGMDFDIFVEWMASDESTQNLYRVTYHQLEDYDTNSTEQVVNETAIHLTDLLAGRNYSIAVTAISNNTDSEETVVYQSTRPISPVIEVLEPISGRTVNVSWINSDDISFKWVVPNRRVDDYKIVLKDATNEESKQITANNETDFMTVLMDSLRPGKQYSFNIYRSSQYTDRKMNKKIVKLSKKWEINVKVVKTQIDIN